jgi:hypothetical protein
VGAAQVAAEPAKTLIICFQHPFGTRVIDTLLLYAST